MENLKKMMDIEILKSELKVYKFYFWFFLIMLFVGVSLNSIVIFANDYKMPVLSNKEFNNPLHFSYYEPSQIKLWSLSDIFEIGESTLSIGDFIIIFSFSFIIILFISITWNETKILRILKEMQKQIKLEEEKYNGKTNRL